MPNTRRWGLKLHCANIETRHEVTGSEVDNDEVNDKPILAQSQDKFWLPYFIPLSTTSPTISSVSNMDNANYIPLGVKGGKINEAVTVTLSMARVTCGPKVIGETKEERKVIAREIGLKARKEKKRIKSEARAARKANAILHRKLNRSTKKYNKNEERNKQRKIDLERQKIRCGAIKQAEALAAIHDPTGKTFNVGEIIVLPGGIVKTKEGLRRAAEEKEKKQRQDAARQAALQEYKDADAAARLEAQEAQQAEGEGRPLPTYFPAKEALSKMVKPKKLSKKQLQRQELKPRPAPPKPTIPEGISLPDDEENLLALWDITDEDIKKRLIKKKKEKAAGRKDQIKIKKNAKKLKKALKVMKEQADNAGVAFDQAAARKEILDAQAINVRKRKDKKKNKKVVISDAESNSDSDSSSGSDSDSGSDMEEAKVEPIERQGMNRKRTTSPKLEVTLIERAAEPERASKANNEVARERREQEPEQKKAEESKTDEGKQLAAAKQANKEKKGSRRAAKLAAEASEKPTKRKRPDDDEERNSPQNKKAKTPVVAEVKKKSDSKKLNHEGRRAKLEVQNEGLQERDSKKQESSDTRPDRDIAERESRIAAETSDHVEKHIHGAEQWNPDKLTGDAARKDKFRRLLGAGKVASKEGEKSNKEKKEMKGKNQPAVDIDKITLDLERQFEAGNKMKHDGGRKRRGLGA
ncbi:hypothetical protein QTJ16_000800 [Diplocarpon rosae]|uniref:Small acidic protein n=1 Tax=Diplocarpon rosae TaxID=946125 RepID=A0AAD9T5Z4_9HELO|nr:hypothetical protein QTJ16_000800 [Diplocarpon rosae]